MAETAENEYYDQEDQSKAMEEENAYPMTQDSLFLFELNLVMMIASLSLSNQELSEFEEMEKLNDKQQQDIKVFVSKLQSRKRGFDELTVHDRPASRSRLQTKVLDSRHGRKV